MVGSGPFKFVEWVAGDHIMLAGNKDYWDPYGMPNIDEFIYRVIPEASGRTAALRTGVIDFARIPVSEIDAISEDSGLDVVTHEDMGWILFNMNQNSDRTALFVDVPVRQSLMYALDRQLIVEQVYLGQASQANGMQPRLSIAYDESRIDTIYTFDPEKAKALLEETGWVDSDCDGIREKAGVRFSFECLFAENYRNTSRCFHICSRRGQRSASPCSRSPCPSRRSTMSS